MTSLLVSASLRRPARLVTHTSVPRIPRLAHRPPVLPPPCWRCISVLQRAVTPPRVGVLTRAIRRGYASSAPAFPHMDDTIYALSSAPGRAAIAVIRVSGPAVREVYYALCPTQPLPKPRYAAVRTLCHPLEQSRNVLDSNALVLFFPGPKTVTGEDVLELHVHGGRATVKALLSAIPLCSARRGAIRYAEPGEFTKRAFLNDRLDLTQVDSLSETLSAETEQQRRAAERGNSQELSRRYESWRNELLLARGEMEALIDFSEDQHFDESPVELMGNVTSLVNGILHSIRQHEEGSQRSQLLRSGIKIALLGPPNVGKSSLMNQIVGKEASIVSSEAGTTRDIVEVSLDMRGYLCSFADTAGFRGEDPALCNNATVGPNIGAIEKEGIRRARAAALSADVIIAQGSVEPLPAGAFTILYDAETLRLAVAHAKPFLIAVNKRDTIEPSQFDALVAALRREIAAIPGLADAPPPIAVSCREAQAAPATGAKALGVAQAADPGGIRMLTDRLLHIFENMTSMPADLEDLLGVTERQRQLLAVCRGHLEDYIAEASPTEGAEADIVLAAEHLRHAGTALARITGRGDVPDVEDVLGVIFEKFCVGK